ncbi:MAG: kinase/pyrophosphorylase, partial [Moraxellaceae bacterium]|nr:kinase/pyrophosphorylase [Moraxellaceae bacterium]
MTDNLKRTVFFVSDGTGITAETLGRSLLAQFESMTFEEVTVPFVDTLEKAAHLVREINKVAEIEGSRPIIIDTIVDKSIRSEIAQANGYMMDVFETFVDRLQDELCSKPVNAVGKSHSIINNATYNV